MPVKEGCLGAAERPGTKNGAGGKWKGEWWVHDAFLDLFFRTEFYEMN